MTSEQEKNFARESGLLRSEIVSSRGGYPTLRLGDRYLLSRYDPRKESSRQAERIAEKRVAVVGLGLGYLAAALGPRATTVLVLEGEEERFERSGMEDSEGEAIRAKWRICSDLRVLERAVAAALGQGNEIVFDPSFEAAPVLRDGLAAIVHSMRGSPLISFIHLKTAGDVLRSLAAVQAYKRLQPHATVEFITERPYGELAGMAAGIDRIIELEPGGTLPGRDPCRPLVAFNFGGDSASARLLEAVRPVFGAGYAERDGRIELIDERMPGRVDELTRLRNHMNRYHLYFAILGLPMSSAPPVLDPGPTEEGLPGGPYRVAQFGAGSGQSVWAPKRVDPLVFGEALRRLGGRWIAVGGQGEAVLARAAGIEDADNFCGRTSWRGLARILTGASLYVGHDSGPSHLAAALGVPTLALFGFTSPILNAPIGPKAFVLQADLACAFSGCRIPCADLSCTAFYTPQVIVDAVNFIEGTSGDRWLAAEKIYDAGFRLIHPGAAVEDRDPLIRELEAEPRVGVPRDPAAALAREWLEHAER